MIENTYVIAWSSKLRSSGGQGKKLFSREEAEELARELNRDYPELTHEPLRLNSGQSNAVTPSNVIDLGAELVTASAGGTLPAMEAEVA